ncbi:S9 family peptidase [Alkalitalea saponilacus]|uniref:Dipeptidyl aminopeptidase/acylaminoacyl peptidase n=1 Tax=Alkalitalea saponilacus TaxID=889453 RepID=A0A1T5GUI9_9BACT|nr:S9 family peptidase [Alkalitalea saponilacus]ASB48184.1 peptidase S9 [Alkalitalea saponilacus]SKC12054.1 Dipeptidyl aminopeptidase/acylaminoacyl peptidase [Alkalitalea saponilacus]
MKKLVLLTLAIIFCFSSCRQEAHEKSYDTLHFELSGDRMTPEALWSFGRLGNISVAPDQNTITYTITYPHIEENRFYSDIYTIPVNGGEPTRITNTSTIESQVNWRPDGEKINYISNESGSSQLWEINADGSGRQQVSDVDGGISGYLFSPDMSHIAYIRRVKLDESINDRHPDLPHANARVDDDLMYRHWDTWHDQHYRHIFIAPYKSGQMVRNGKDIMQGERFDSPMKPFGGMEQIAWTPCGTKLAYTCKKLAGRDYAFSTNSDIYLYDLNNETTTNLTEGMPGYDKNPKFSSDGRLMLWESMERDGYESDKNRLMVMDMETGEVADFSIGFDHNVSGPVWDETGEFVWFVSSIGGTEQIYLMDLADGGIHQITEGQHNFRGVQQVGEQLIASRESMSSPADLFKIDLRDGTTSNLTNINTHIMDQVTMGTVEERWVTTTDNKEMLVWVIYPPNFDPEKKYPAILYCQGGPQGALSQFWSYRWNFQMMAANDYIVVAPNRRGMPGHGTEWNEQISGDWGGQNLLDYLSAIDALAEEPYVDENRLGAVGASYGGYSVFWLAGNHDGRFSAFISHCGVFNLDMMYTNTEEMFFVDWDLDGPYWEQPDNRYDYSPHLFVENWDTPMLVIHGAKDFRVPYSQGMGAFNAARALDLPARFLFFPEENHWVLSPQNGILWQREFAGWLNEWLK